MSDSGDDKEVGREEGVEDTANESGATSGQLKRKRDHSHNVPIPNHQTPQLPSWVAGGSPAKLVDRDELLGMSSALENMALVHEMSVNPEFALDPSPHNPLERTVRECMHRAFWDQIQQDLDNHPPDYSHAFGVLLDIKKMILDIIPEDRVRLRGEVEAQLDEPLMRQQLERGCLDTDRVFKYLFDLMGRLCAPARDEQLTKIKNSTDIVDTLRGVCELLEETKVDMANFAISQNRAQIEAHSAEYERNQFDKLLASEPGMRTTVTEWLMRHVGDEGATDPSASPSAKKRFEDMNNSEVSAIISRAYIELLDWDLCNTYPATLLTLLNADDPNDAGLTPISSTTRSIGDDINRRQSQETMQNWKGKEFHKERFKKMDRSRLESLSEKVLQLRVCVCSVLITCNLAGKTVSQLPQFKSSLKNQLILITNDIDRSNINSKLESVAVQCEDTVSKAYKQLDAQWSDENSSQLRSQLLAISNPHNHIAQLIKCRVESYMEWMISGEGKKERLPAGVSVVGDELNAVTARFARIVSHNRATFGTLYAQLIQDAMAN